MTLSLAKLLEQHVLKLCEQPRVPQTEGYFKARAYLAEQIRAMDLEPQYHDFFDIPAGPCRNIFVEKGPAEGPRILIGAHYETTPKSGVGADDNASAVAVVLELLRHLPNSLPVTAVFFDVEENFGLGALHGSSRFASWYKKALRQVFIFDLVGGALCPGMEDAYFQFGNGCPHLKAEGLEFFYFPILFLEPFGPLYSRSDYQAFRKRKIPYTFISSGTPWYYHTHDDKPSEMRFSKMARLVNGLENEITKMPSTQNTPDWKQFSQFLDIVKKIPGVLPEKLPSPKSQDPSRWQIIGMYKQILPALRQLGRNAWNRPSAGH